MGFVLMLSFYREDGPFKRFNDALVRNYKVMPWGCGAFEYLGADAWPRVMPNDPLPFIFTGVPPKSFEQKIEEKEREARQS